MRPIEKIEADIKNTKTKIENRTCYGAIPNELLKEYEEELRLACIDGISTDVLKAICAARKDGRLAMLPEGFEHTKELWRVIPTPWHCDENGNHCDECRYGREDACTFKPYISKINTVNAYKAFWSLLGLEISRESAEAVLATQNHIAGCAEPLGAAHE